MSKLLPLVVAVTLGVVGCHHARTEPPHSAADNVGVYQFNEHVSATGAAAEYIDIVGEVVVLADTVTVDARPGPCRADENVRPPTPFTFRCGTNVVLTFDRRDPTTRAAYAAMLAENVSRQVCARYEMDSNGRRYCAETRTETSQRMSRRSGYLNLTRVPGAEVPKEPPR
jgi:hypothetical protein